MFSATISCILHNAVTGDVSISGLRRDLSRCNLLWICFFMFNRTNGSSKIRRKVSLSPHDMLPFLRCSSPFSLHESSRLTLTVASAIYASAFTAPRRISQWKLTTPFLNLSLDRFSSSWNARSYDFLFSVLRSRRRSTLDCSGRTSDVGKSIQNKP
jgi:hypothetical protein